MKQLLLLTLILAGLQGCKTDCERHKPKDEGEITGKLNIDIFTCIQYPNQCVIRNDSEYAANIYMDSIRSDCKQAFVRPAVDFSQNSLLVFMGSVGCKGSMTPNVTRDNTNKKVTFEMWECNKGLCKSEWRRLFVVTVPPIPADYTVEFVKKK